MTSRWPSLLWPSTLPVRAVALSYYSFLALVPLGGLCGAVLELIGAHRLSLQVRRFLLAQLGLSSPAASQMSALLSRADAKLLGSLSGLLLLGSAIALVMNVEAALDEMFQAPHSRSLLERGLRTLAIFCLGPVLLGGSLFLTARWHSQLASPKQLPWLGFVVGPFGLIVLALFLLYRYGPNAPVASGAAALGAFIAGLVWELAKHGYSLLAEHAYRQDAVLYGPLAAIPVLLLWIQVSWLVVLGGARLAAAAAGRLR